MDMDPAERGGVEWVSEFCPVKGSSSYIKKTLGNLTQDRSGAGNAASAPCCAGRVGVLCRI